MGVYTAIYGGVGELMLLGYHRVVATQRPRWVAPTQLASVGLSGCSCARLLNYKKERTLAKHKSKKRRRCEAPTVGVHAFECDYPTLRGFGLPLFTPFLTRTRMGGPGWEDRRGSSCLLKEARAQAES